MKKIKNKYLLSICIPTANRKKELTNQLKNIQSQITNEYRNLIQIVIGENTTSENQFINLVSFSNLNIKHIKNDGNIGYARNINSIIKNADGKFAWLLSDDDILRQEAISTIIEKIKSRKKINYVTFDCGGAFKGNLFNDQMYFKNVNQLFYEKGKDFLIKHWSSIIFVSINIFNKSEVLKHMNKNNLIENINEVYQSSLIGISFVQQNGKVLIIDKPLLDDNYGNKVYSPENINDVAIDKYYKLLKQLIDFGINIEVINQLSSELLRNILNYGIYSVIYRIEFRGILSFKEVYKKISSDKKIQISLRFAAFYIYTLLNLSKTLAKTGVKILLFLKRNSYSTEKTKVMLSVKNSKEKIVSTY